ncbi:HD-GYP domain-containing protein [Blastopirellula sp. JC732]|uniref:HD-GYP domain-containing protein n=1 Tax=Blastopirellula sediminis TaxID=2894196 RepID=A0A9X1MKS4_9BACT|nr:HD-GYP domain-containing protein [Blastopirellula sediminis]MCC9609481.1 HD-GYP domain-containing protein [Blastopirellula sediminis]MCC9627742.1 HD-GYP domain-containing protein [Blastopirellula sediminis]
MSTLPGAPALPTKTLERHANLHRLELVNRELQNWFGVDFTYWDGETGEMMRAAEMQPPGDENYLSPIIRTVAAKKKPEIVAEQAGACILAMPLAMDSGTVVATSPFVTGDSYDCFDDVEGLARILGTTAERAAHWGREQNRWTTQSLERMARLQLSKLSVDDEARRLSNEIDKISDSLSSTYEEISLLYGLTQNLRISSSDEQLGDLALNWLLEVLPCEGLAIQFLPTRGENVSTKGRTETKTLSVGICPLEAEQLSRLVSHLNLGEKGAPFVANQRITAREEWPFPKVRQLIVVPLAEGDNIFGWIMAFNHCENKGFGTVEASLLSSVGAILGIHSGNIELYRQQSEFVTSVVQALTSAIDAKDPYTCGHSDRVARLSVCLARQMGQDTDSLNLLYMAGLLHDVGKIGIDDSVLRKPGRLTDAEYEHIKLHPELGYNILKGLKQIEKVLPVVLHHHEQWDGKGYPHRLKGTDTPLLARITAVADAYDAMSSDRPYRKGMPEEKVDAIFREGAGQQWDPAVINAFFAARDELRDILSEERAEIRFDVRDWLK